MGRRASEKRRQQLCRAHASREPLSCLHPHLGACVHKGACSALLLAVLRGVLYAGRPLVPLGLDAVQILPDWCACSQKEASLQGTADQGEALWERDNWTMRL